MRFALFALLLLLPGAAFAAEEAPSVDTFKKVIEEKLQSLKSTGFTERNVVFQEVRAGKPNGSSFPFQVTAIVRDYAPGYPANRYYGQTCVGRMERWPFQMTRDSFGDWQVSGRMTITDGTCKDNPAEGVSAFPLAEISSAPRR